LGFEPKGRIFSVPATVRVVRRCGHRPNTTEPRKRAENQSFGAYRACGTALSQPRSCKERDAAQTARNRPQFEQFGSRLSLVAFCSSWKLLIRWEFWLRGVDLNHRPLGYEPKSGETLGDEASPNVEFTRSTATTCCWGRLGAAPRLAHF